MPLIKIQAYLHLVGLYPTNKIVRIYNLKLYLGKPETTEKSVKEDKATSTIERKVCDNGEG